MAKATAEFVCQTCGAKSAAFIGHCPYCGAWGSYVETPTEISSPTQLTKAEKAKLIKFGEVSSKPVKRVLTQIVEVDRVLGGGIVPASVILIAGEPGIGKSTLLLQLAARIVQDQSKVIYVTGEESPDQINLRADRLNLFSGKLKDNQKPSTNKFQDNFFLSAETNVEKIISALISEKPDLVIIDSVQTMAWSALTGSPGSVGQVRESARILAQVAKENNFTLILVGHVTKEGVIAGPKILEHLVDVVLQFEGDTQHNFRILRSAKNRFGPISEVGVFEMTEVGLAEVPNPSKVFLTERADNVTGSAIFATVTGARVILVEIQALAVPTTFSQPKRVVNGLDAGRISQILGVISKIFKIPVNNFDLFVNLAGGLEILEPAADLPIALALLSIFWSKPVPKLVSFGEIGLLGELREVGRQELRKIEAAKFGFSRIIDYKLESIGKAAYKVFPR